MALDGDILVQSDQLPWLSLVEGFEIRILRTSAETGDWTVLLKCEQGSSFARHRHYGAGEYYVISGRMEYRAGTAVTGDYGYEPLGAVHDKTSFPEETLLLFTNHGPVMFLDEEDNVIGILNHETLIELEQQHAA